ncbi:riboflavin synthase [Sphingomonas sp.]|jgi:riboflavin synthase|uniref:riboflavin synthase n=1 Tax=Sphingomonas sp. TaxID=28214 RepID=UPI002D7E556B|nr:riboflavin synthase [Sphingomonas sp.]HEU0045434.1 riboflavin synthase [Sphingomonas sp.]
MFTGIVSDIGQIRSVEMRGDTRVVVGTAYDTATVDLGASIACSGVCLTVVDKGTGWFAVDVSGETLSRTAQGQWTEGKRLNLERALKVGDELGGHIVTGHVDGVAAVIDVRADGDSKRIGLRLGAELAPFIAPKGSITIDGVSLTVNDVRDERDTHFSVNVIPHTQAHTTLGEMETGQAVNIEIDVLARYLQRMEAYRAKAG